LARAGVLDRPDEGHDALIDQFAMGLAFQLNWLELSGLKAETPRALVERAAALALSPVARLVSGEEV
jgi:hypothetical protein